jgi:L-aspartate oxidase
VARSIVRESEQTPGAVCLTLAHLDAGRVRSRFPTIAEMCRQLGIDIAVDPSPVGPAAHYLMGGIDTDTWGRTSVPGLFAAGETACTGVHGANRLASNSLLEGLVFGARAATAMTEPPRAAPPGPERVAASPGVPPGAAGAAADDLDVPAIRDLMWRFAGLFRTGEGLAHALARLDATYVRERASKDTRLGSSDWWRRFNLLTVARLIAAAALRREESRGGHFRADFPARDDLHWKVHLFDHVRHGQ